MEMSFMSASSRELTLEILESCESSVDAMLR